jgi:hypothetical protein
MRGNPRIAIAEHPLPEVRDFAGPERRLDHAQFRLKHKVSIDQTKRKGVNPYSQI